MDANQQFYDFVYDAVIKLLNDKRITLDDLNDEIQVTIEYGKRLYKDATIDVEKLTRNIIYDYGVIEGTTTVLENNRDHIEWLSEARANIKWNFWNRYKKYLEKIEHLPPSVINSIGNTTDEILKRLESPKREGSWDRRGMVVGNVQSGKTSNYTGLIAKAVDAQYKVIIVLAGLNNDLRSQTQKRIDKGFIGRDTRKKDSYDQTDSKIGAGLMPGFPELPVIALTSADAGGDFKKKIHEAVTVTPGGDPIIVVVKKNVTPLKNLLNWFESQNKSGKIQNVPLLLIDDEADNASIDTKAAKMIGITDISDDDEEHDPTKINGYIRQILNSFSQSAYIGYTATPFANIFIYPIDEKNKGDKYGEDLFPRSFIINLHAPSNYIGPEKVFGLAKDKLAGIEEVKPLPLTRSVSDYELAFPYKHKIDWKVPNLPDSLYRAVYAFIISAAVRDLRGQGKKHHSMLVHVTRFVNVQEQVTDLLKTKVGTIVEALEFKTGPIYQKLIGELEALWNEDFSPTTDKVIEALDDNGITTVTWDEVKEKLFECASKIEVRAINGKAADGGLEYDSYPNGLSVIAVGGDKLSRGLTLEGLTISYYCRMSKMYDTLLQMGRWFGYRPGYADLCRLYTSKQLIGWYKHIAVANEELRNDFDDMAAMNLTPEDYGLKVRTHPDGMIVTALNKMRNSETRSVTFSGKLVQITRFYKKNSSNQKNVDFLCEWLKTIGRNYKKPGTDTNWNHMWSGVTVDKIFDFLNKINIHPTCFSASAKVVSDYIKSCNDENELVNWSVAVVSTKKGEVKDLGEIKIGMSWRSDANDKEDDTLQIIRNNLITEIDQGIDLKEDERKAALDKTIAAWEENGRAQERPETPSPIWIRNCRDKSRALLLIYVFQSGKVVENDVRVPYEDTYLGYAISFPGSPTAKPVEYRVDEVYRRNESYEE